MTLIEEMEANIASLTEDIDYCQNLLNDMLKSPYRNEKFCEDAQARIDGQRHQVEIWKTEVALLKFRFANIQDALKNLQN